MQSPRKMAKPTDTNNDVALEINEYMSNYVTAPSVNTGQGHDSSDNHNVEPEAPMALHPNIDVILKEDLHSVREPNATFGLPSFDEDDRVMTTSHGESKVIRPPSKRPKVAQSKTLPPTSPDESQTRKEAIGNSKDAVNDEDELPSQSSTRAKRPKSAPILPPAHLLRSHGPAPDLSLIPDLGTPAPSPPKRSTNSTSAKQSPFFKPASSPAKRPRSPGGALQAIPIPPLTSPSFGLLQEQLCHDPLRLLIGITFLIRTAGRTSIPVFYQLMEKYPTAAALAEADRAEIVEMTRHLGLQEVRADTYIRYARTFLENRPVKGKRYRVVNYPVKGAHKGIAKDEVLPDNEEDPREAAWEIGHLTQGAYALDSWRIFCRDECRGLATSWNGEDAKEEGFQPEWMRVLPKDKELRAFLRWCWLREGWVWDADTGEKTVSEEGFLDAVNERRVMWQWKGRGAAKMNRGHYVILDMPLKEEKELAEKIMVKEEEQKTEQDENAFE
jgi:hypothetical protein